MTPLGRFYSGFLPDGLPTWLAMTWTYALAGLVLFYFAGISSDQIIYIDLQEAQ